MEFVLFGIVLGGVLLAHGGVRRRRRGVVTVEPGGAAARPAAVAPARAPDAWVPGLLALGVAVVVPLMIDTNARYFLYSRMALIAIIVMSVTILTGWAGQLSLAQFALAGLGP